MNGDTEDRVPFLGDAFHFFSVDVLAPELCQSYLRIISGSPTKSLGQADLD